MIWLTWRQFRPQALVAVFALAVVAVTLAVTGPHIVHLYDTSVALCQAHRDCSTATDAFLKYDHLLQAGLNSVVLVVPGLVGIFWGAPLVARELETGTFRLAWTQSVTRERWQAVKLVALGLVSMAVAGLLSLMVTWWSSPFDRVTMNRFTPAMFGQRGLAPIGYAALAFVVGVAAGVLIRRTVPAMATTLVAFVAARLAVAFWLRPHFAAPAHRDVALDLGSVGGVGHLGGGPVALILNPPNIPNAWIYSSQIADRTGHPLTAQLLASTCPGIGTGGPPPVGGSSPSPGPVAAGAQQAFQDCVARVGTTFHEVVAYQPANRYWAFQWYELAICLGAALALGGFCFWWIRRRLT